MEFGVTKELLWIGKSPMHAPVNQAEYIYIVLYYTDYAVKAH